MSADYGISHFLR